MSRMTPTLVFDIESIPDTNGIRRIHDLSPDMSDSDVAEFAFARQREKNKTDFLPLYLQRVVTISVLFRTDSIFQIWSLTEPQLNEAQIIDRFFQGIDRYTPNLVSWNGSGFDLPVLHYRAMAHGVVAKTYWDKGEDDRRFKYNNYHNRYHARHTDLMKVIGSFDPRAMAPLDHLCKVYGLPGKVGMHGGSVWESFRDGNMHVVDPYCETDVMNLYLLYLLYQRMRGVMSPEAYAEETSVVHAFLSASDKDHWKTFLAAWDAYPISL